ncbi:hypothetical protein HYH03_002095 [Edaphochlamys debaryana]|uniref:Bicarbonate transporter-like transmembrane domain-containing protein n=1 Tax=Edaphochlamys debaryana TaxID=47281 RepID=A0A835YDN8_9CHLO|nr:hypothetical protein HYH03_002095 [Edaphochlamys debaryana]|eukprot:KAG2499799.1 hypothetical protein HYH03_002095 [Edaphochlamys debaryana]
MFIGNDAWAELRGRLGVYKDDWRDGFGAGTRILAPATYIFLASLLPALAFGLQLNESTRSQLGVVQVLAATAITGVLQALIGGQPLLIVGVAEPIVIIYGFMFQFADQRPELGPDLFLPWAAWVCVWTAAMVLLLGLLNACRCVSVFTRFSGELFGALIGLLFLQEAIKGLIANFRPDPSSADGTGGGGSGGGGAEAPPVAADEYVWRLVNGLWGLLLAGGLLVCALAVVQARSWRFLEKRTRGFLADYGPPAMVLTWTGVSYILSPANGGAAPAGVPRRVSCGDVWDSIPGWTVAGRMGQVPPEHIASALLPAAIIAVLFYFDHTVSSLMAQQPEYGLVRPPAYSYDMVVLAAVTALTGLLGLPPVNGVLPQAPMHTRSLASLGARLGPKQARASSSAKAPGPLAAPPAACCLPDLLPSSCCCFGNEGPSKVDAAANAGAAVKGSFCGSAEYEPTGNGGGGGGGGSGDRRRRRRVSRARRGSGDGTTEEGEHGEEAEAHVPLALAEDPGGPNGARANGAAAVCSSSGDGGTGRRPHSRGRRHSGSADGGAGGGATNGGGAGGDHAPHIAVQLHHRRHPSAASRQRLPSEDGPGGATDGPGPPSPLPSTTAPGGSAADGAAAASLPLRVVEQRMSGLLQSLGVAACLFATPAIRQIPQAVLWGYFAFMAIESCQGSQLVERALLLLTDPSRRPWLLARGPHAAYLETVPFRVIAAFTVLQLCLLAGLWALVTWAGVGGIAFPLPIALLLPARRWLLPRLFRPAHLRELDAAAYEQAPPLPPPPPPPEAAALAPFLPLLASTSPPAPPPPGHATPGPEATAAAVSPPTIELSGFPEMLELLEDVVHAAVQHESAVPDREAERSLIEAEHVGLQPVHHVSRQEVGERGGAGRGTSMERGPGAV